MTAFDKQKRTLDDLPSMVTVPAVEIAGHKPKNRSKEHCAAISKSKKEYYSTPEGMAERQLRSERTKLYWASPEGQAKKARLRAKYKGVKRNLTN